MKSAPKVLPLHNKLSTPIFHSSSRPNGNYISKSICLQSFLYVLAYLSEVLKFLTSKMIAKIQFPHLGSFLRLAALKETPNASSKIAKLTRQIVI